MSTLENMNNVARPHKIIWECLFAYDYHHRKSDGYGDDNYSHTTREQKIWHVAAPELGLAKAAWLFHHPAHVGYELVSCVPICIIDAELRV